MLHIILLVLKIIGIVLLCILGFVLLAACCALFVPVRYRIEVTREEAEGNPPVVIRAKVTWLLHLVNILVCYPAEVYVRVRIFLFTLFRIPEAEKKEKKAGRKKQNGKKKQNKEKDSGVQGLSGKDADGSLAKETERNTDGEAAGNLAVKAESNVHGEAAGNLTGEPVSNTGRETAGSLTGKAAGNGNRESAGNSMDEASVDENQREAATESDPEEAGGLFHRIFCKIQDFMSKIKQILEKIQESLKNIRYTIRRFCDKIKSTSDTIKYYCEVLQSDAFRGSWSLCKEQIGDILRVLKPDKFEADLIIGMDDPASTGEILAVYGMMYPWIGQHVRVMGDFDRSRIEGQLYLKGKIRAFTFLRIALKVYRNKDIKALIKLFKKEAV